MSSSAGGSRHYRIDWPPAAPLCFRARAPPPSYDDVCVLVYSYKTIYTQLNKKKVNCYGYMCSRGSFVSWLPRKNPNIRPKPPVEYLILLRYYSKT